MIISISAKCSDLCATMIYNSKRELLYEHDGYVPDFMPDDHYGDYVILDIDLKTGKILNWTATEAKVKAWVKRTRTDARQALGI